MDASITADQRHWWRISLELKLRKYSGDAFQDFFSKVMQNAHGDDFVQIRPFGKLGDKGCDGYLKSTGQVFQCYGALNANPNKVSYLIGKMRSDFAKAKKGIPSIMREWYMVHNLVDGLPIEAVTTLDELQSSDKAIQFGFIGIEGFEDRIFALDPDKIETLLGIGATSCDAQNLQFSELRDLIASVAVASDQIDFKIDTIQPVSPEKLEFNYLPNHWKWLILSGWQNAHSVASYLNHHTNPLIGEKIAQRFHNRYQYLKTQHLQSGAVMSALYEDITGIGDVTASLQVAAHALLAFLFENCDIFEEPLAAVVI